MVPSFEEKLTEVSVEEDAVSFLKSVRIVEIE